MNFEETLTNLQEKIGKDNAGLIADDIASLLSYENARNKEVKKKDKEIEKLKETKEKLIEANGNLLQQISVETKDVEIEPQASETTEPHFNLKDAFDKDGNFIK